MKNPFGRTIAGRLRLFSLATVIPLLAMAGILLYQAWVELPRQVAEGTLGIAEEAGHQMDDFLQRTGKLLTALAQVREIRDLESREASDLLLRLKQRFPEYDSLTLYDLQGRIVASSDPGAIGFAMGEMPVLQRAISTGRMAVTDVLVSRRTGNATIAANHPFTDTDGRVKAVVAATIDLTYLPDALPRVRLSEGYRLTVFDQTGEPILQEGHEGSPPFANLCASCHAQPSPRGTMPSKVWLGQDYVHALTTTSQGWHVLVNARVEDVLGASQRQGWLTLALVAALLVVAVGASTLSGRRMAAPIMRLAAAARRFGAGETVPPLPVRGADEIRALTQSFDSMMADILESRRRLEERQARLDALHELDRAMSSTLSLTTVLDILTEEVHGLGAVEGVAIYLLDDERNLGLSNAKGMARPLVTGPDYQRWLDLAQRAVGAAMPVSVEVPTGGGEGDGCAAGGCLGVALASKGRVLGAILFCTSSPEGFGSEEQQFLYGVALQASAAVENARLYGLEKQRVAELEALSRGMKLQRDELQRAQDGIVETLNLSLQAKDPYTKGHADRVSLVARRIAGRLGLPREQQEVLGRAARLHDIGKISIPEHLLDKKGPLTPPERSQFELHPERSAELLSHLPDLDRVLPAIRAHHERFDGKGYPDGLAGEEIPLEARIIAVADAYDALTTDRPYRNALSHEEALAVLRANAGSQWDPQVVRAALDFFHDQEQEQVAGR